jgi:hypothetical protein
MRRTELFQRGPGKYDRVTLTQTEEFPYYQIYVDLDHPYILEYVREAKESLFVKGPLASTLVYDYGRYYFIPTVDHDLNRKLCEWSSELGFDAVEITVHDIDEYVPEKYPYSAVHVLAGYTIRLHRTDHLTFYMKERLVGVHLREDTFPRAFRKLKCDLVAVESQWYEETKKYYPDCLVFNDPRYPCVMDPKLLVDRLYHTYYHPLLGPDTDVMFHSLVRTRRILYRNEWLTYEEFPVRLLPKWIHPWNRLYHALTKTKIPTNVLMAHARML